MQFFRTARSAKSKLLALSFCIAAIAPLAHADDASHRAKAEEMLRLTHTESALHEQLTNLQTRVGELAKQQFNLPSPTAEQTSMMTEYQGKIQQVTANEVGWDKMRPLLVNLYAESFTDAELDGIITFYKSPAGTSLVDKMPQVASKTGALVQDHIKALQPQLATLTQSYAEKMKLTPPAGAAPPPSLGPSSPSTPSTAPKAPARP